MIFSPRITAAATTRRFLAKGILLSSIFCAGSAFAQEPETPEVTADNSQLNEIVVTAQRRTQSLQKVPVAVTALSSEALLERNISTAQDLMQVTPGLQVSTQTGGNSGGSATFFLRGMGQERSGNGSEPSVGIYVDDIYYPSLQGTVFNIVDLEQVEVLRGPQGTLFGRNTIGGAIRYTTKRPSDEFEGNVRATYGSYDRTDIIGVVNIPLGGVAAVRITGGHLERDGFVKRSNGTPNAGATKTDLIRGQLRITPASNFDIELSAQYAKDRLDGFTYRTPGPINPIPGTNPDRYNRTPAGMLNPFDDRYSSKCGFCQFGTDFPEFNRNKVGNASATIEWNLSDNFTLKSLTGWTHVVSMSGLDFDKSPLPIGGQFQSTLTEAVSQELQVSTQLFDSRLNLVGGLYYYDERFIFARNLSQETFFLGVPRAVFEITRDTENISGYIDGSILITDKLTGLFGLRLSRDNKDARAETPAGLFVSSQSTSFSSTTRRIGLQYQWTGDVMTYATISETVSKRVEWPEFG